MEPMTAKEPTWESFRISRRRSRIPAGPDGVGHIHKAVQVDAARQDPRGGAEDGSLDQHRQRKKIAQQTPQPPDEADLQAHQGQAPQELVPGLLIPDLNGAGYGAEHGLAHNKRVKQGLHFGIPPL